jgi:hypothetical protein
VVARLDRGPLQRGPLSRAEPLERRGTSHERVRLGVQGDVAGEQTVLRQRRQQDHRGLGTAQLPRLERRYDVRAVEVVRSCPERPQDVPEQRRPWRADQGAGVVVRLEQRSTEAEGVPQPLREQRQPGHPDRREPGEQLLGDVVGDDSVQRRVGRHEEGRLQRVQ